MPLLLFVFAFAAVGSSVIYPTQRLPLTFSHARHLALPDIGCMTCHASAATSVRASDVLIPTEAACTGCHAIDRAQPEKVATPPARCDACHAGAPTERVSIPTPNLLFNHKIHADRQIACGACHDMRGVDLATRAQLPSMALCLGCHDGEKARSTACTTCHPTGPAGLLRTDFSEGKLVPAGSHDLRFRTDHAAAAKSDAKSCNACHTRAYCMDCHNGKQKPLDFHVGDYVHLHAVDARRQTTTCTGCHRLQTFCVGCHARSGVDTDPKTSEYQRPSRLPPGSVQIHAFHPSGWASGHRVQAERNLSQCVSCHREDFCMECHAAQFDPHPPGWATSSRCKALLTRAGRTCLRCHLRAEDARCG